MGVMARAARREQGFVYIERGRGSVKREAFFLAEGLFFFAAHSGFAVPGQTAQTRVAECRAVARLPVPHGFTMSPLVVLTQKTLAFI